MKKKAYQAHEQAYQKLRKDGCSSWDEWRKQSTDFDGFCMREFMESALADSSFESNSPSALKIGCGTGPLSCFLAKRGFNVQGVDVSTTAITIAEQEARKRNLDIEYRVVDVCSEPLGLGRYDLVIDGHCLHCIVDPKDRASTLQHIREALKPDGQFWVDSMIAANNTIFGDDLHLDEDGTLWLRINGPSKFGDQMSINGQWYLPTRKLHLSSEAFASELQNAGFKINWKRTLAPDKCVETAGFQAICRIK